MKEKVFVVLFVAFMIVLFMHAFYKSQAEFAKSINGLIIDKKKGSKGSLVVTINNSLNNQKEKYIFTPTEETWKSIFSNDSISKIEYSYSVIFYTFNGTKYAIKDTLELYHY